MQAKVRGGRDYQPLIAVNGGPCWPSEPDYANSTTALRSKPRRAISNRTGSEPRRDPDAQGDAGFRFRRARCRPRRYSLTSARNSLRRDGRWRKMAARREDRRDPSVSALAQRGSATTRVGAAAGDPLGFRQAVRHVVGHGSGRSRGGLAAATREPSPTFAARSTSPTSGEAMAEDGYYAAQPGESSQTTRSHFSTVRCAICGRRRRTPSEAFAGTCSSTWVISDPAKEGPPGVVRARGARGQQPLRFAVLGGEREPDRPLHPVPPRELRASHIAAGQYLRQSDLGRRLDRVAGSIWVASRRR